MAMTVELIQATPLDGIFAGYRECWASQLKGDGGGEKDVKMVERALFKMDPTHSSPIEHALYTWRVAGISRALSHQLVRHRIASYSQRSQRYVSEKQFEYVTPPSVDIPVSPDGFDVRAMFNAAMKSAQIYYNDLVDMGIPKEDARMVLPNACCTSLVISMNPRAFRNFLKLRLDTHAQWEIRALAKAMLDSVPEEHKFLYKDLLGAKYESRK